VFRRNWEPKNWETYAKISGYPVAICYDQTLTIGIGKESVDLTASRGQSGRTSIETDQVRHNIPHDPYPPYVAWSILPNDFGGRVDRGDKMSKMRPAGGVPSTGRRPATHIPVPSPALLGREPLRGKQIQ
jgi:hypothetical protein